MERWEDIEVARSERWEDREVASWERWEGSEVARSKRWESSAHNGRFLVLFKGGGSRVSPRLHLLFLMLINKTKEQDVFKIFLNGHRDGNILLRSDASCKKCSRVWK